MSGFVLPRFSPTYVVEQKLGSGSSALVYSAYQRETNKEVVLKVISFSNPWLQREFEREIKNLSMIGKCDYVVSLLDNFVLKSQGVIVEERLRGDLLDYMGATSLSIVDVKKIFYQVCKAVEFVHERNIAHMDIKPENIFMNSVDYVKLGDFGSSTTWEPGVPTIFFSNVGTQFYCAPEVVSIPLSYSSSC
jgi:serine/threonine protein kinase